MPGKITGKVLRNWTSLGEEWRFTYHDGYTEVTDVLGRTEQYHYDYNNELTKRVFADGSANLMERDGLAVCSATPMRWGALPVISTATRDR